MATINGNGLPNIINGTDGDDTINGYGGVDILSGGAGNDNIDGGTADDSLYGGSGNDVLNGGTGPATLLSYYDGGAGNDLLVASSGGVGENFEGGSGIDTVSFAQRGAGVSVHLDFHSLPLIDTIHGVENVIGTNFADTLEGSEGANALSGLDGDDTIRGDGGNDVLDGGRGNDVLDGGTGNDTASYANAANGVTVDLANGGAQNTGNGIDTLISIERVTGSASNDVLTGNSRNNILNGGAGDDRIDGAGGKDILYGGAGNDLIFSGAGNDTINGGAGVDTLSYANATAGVTVNLFRVGAQNTVGAGTDTLRSIEMLVGSSFDDTLGGSSRSNTLWGGAGDDVLNGGGGRDQLYGGAGNDRLNGGADLDTAHYDDATQGVTVDLSITRAQDTVGAGTDTLVNIENLSGSQFADTLTGNNGDNVLNGNRGNDILSGGAGADSLFGKAGFDTASYVDAASGVTVDLSRTTAQNTGGGGIDTLRSVEAVEGSRFADVISGSTRNNTLRGGAGNDVLDGGAGNDVLDGQQGSDTLTGGTGKDKFYFDAALGSGVDTITDFQVGVDRMVLSSQTFEGLHAGVLSSSAFTTGAAAGDANDRIIYNSATGALLFDSDGTGGAAAVQFATISTGLHLNASSFLIA